MRRSQRTLIRQLTRTLDALTKAARPEEVVRARATVLLSYLADVPIAILVANNRARYVDANRHALRLTGYSRNALITMSLWDLTPAPNQMLGRRLWRAFLRRGRMSGRYELRRRDGTVIEADYIAIAHVLPDVHVSALVPVRTPRGLRHRRPPARRPASHARRH